MKAAALPETILPASNGRGILIAVVGPSGAGKDSLITHARRRLEHDPIFMFVRRVITRPADARTEDHDCMSPADFETACLGGAFAVTWNAHGLSYGIPVSARTHIDNGGIAVINGSRAALPAIANSFPAIAVVNITADPPILARRLAARQRENADQVAMRLARTIDKFEQGGQTFTIDNSGGLDAAGDRLVDHLEHVARKLGPEGML